MKDVVKVYTEKLFTTLYGLALIMYAFVMYFVSSELALDVYIIFAVGLMLLSINRFYEFYNHHGMLNVLWYGLFYGTSFWLVYKALYIPVIPITYLLGLLGFFMGTIRVKYQKLFYHLMVVYLVILLPMIVLSPFTLSRKIAFFIMSVVVMLIGMNVIKRESIFESSQVNIQSMILDNATEGFAIHDIIVDEDNVPVDYKFLAVNPAFEAITGLKKDVVEGQCVREVIPSIENHWIKTYGKVALDMDTIHFMNYSKALGKHFKVSAFPVAKGRFVTLFSDVTDQIIMQKNMKENEQVLESLLSDKVTFLKDINHKLRSPLNGLLGSLQLYQETPEKVLLEAMMNETEQIHNIINQISSYVSANEIKYNYKTHDLEQVIKGVMSESFNHFEYKLVDETTINGLLMFDDHVLDLIFKTIFNTSEDFPEGKPLIITMSYREAIEKLSITIRKFGHGYSEEEKGILFNEFFNSYLNKDYMMNLAQVRMVLKNAGGDLILNSQLGEGATFIIELPYRII